MSTNHWKLRTKFLLGLMGFVILIGAGLLVYGYFSGKLKSSADTYYFPPGGTNTINGTVTRTSEKCGSVANVSVALHSNTQQYIAKTDSSGKFTYKNVPSGEWFLNVYKVCGAMTPFGAVGICGNSYMDFTTTTNQTIPRNIAISPFKGRITLRVKTKVNNTESPVQGAKVKLTQGTITGGILDFVDVSYTDRYGGAPLPPRMVESYASDGSVNIEVSKAGYETVHTSMNAEGCIVNVRTIYMSRN